MSNVPTPEDPLAALVPILGHATESIPSLPVLQASFQDDPTIDCLLRLVTGQFPLRPLRGSISYASDRAMYHGLKRSRLDPRSGLTLAWPG